MGIIRAANFVFIVLMIVFIGNLSAEENKSSDYGLFLSPESCFLLGKSKECDILVSINWKVITLGSYCLYNNQSPIAIDCWIDQKQANKTVMLILKKDVIFELRDQRTDKLIFQTSLKLYKKISSLRRKRRNPWSFY